MKKFLTILALSSLLFSGCFGSEDTAPTDNSGSSTEGIYETSEFSMNVPAEWEVLEKENFTSNVPAGTLVAFRSNIKNEIFLANVNVYKKELEEEISTEDYAKSNIAKIKNSMISFKEIAQETKGDGVLYQYEGKRLASDPSLLFKQLFIVKNGMAYTVTAAHLTTEDGTIVKIIDRMLDSFIVK